MKEAYLYKKLDDMKVRCNLCEHRCLIKTDEKGKCGVRINRDGILYTLVYDKVISENVDPIEKKPLFHFLPGTTSLSIAAPGCNFKCFFCQNWQISQMPFEFDYEVLDGRPIPPEKLVQDAQSYGCASISYTYTEPTIFFELAYDTAKLATDVNIKNVFVTNGFMTDECIEMIRPYLDAANIDLKSFSEDFYRERSAARLKPVLRNIKLMHDLGIWIEVTTLLIPGLNDSKNEIGQIAQFLKEISAHIPWHISAYYPQFKSKIPPTKRQKVFEAIEIGKKAGLLYVYGGNIYASEYENTSCGSCGTTLIKREGYLISENKIVENKCVNCGFQIKGIF